MRDVDERVPLMDRILRAVVVLIGLVAVVAVSPRAGWAQDDRPEEPAAPSAEDTPKPNGAVTAIDRAHEAISSRISESADRLDAFLGKARIQEESNQSYLNVALLRTTDEHGVEITKQIKLKIVLPRLQRRLQLVIERDNDGGAIDSEGASGVVEDLTTGPSSGDLTTALRLMVRSARDLNIYIDAGVRVRIHPTVFSRIRYRRSVELEQWAVRFTQSVKWEEQFAENPYQWEVISRLDFDRPISPEYFFRSTLQGAWYEGRHGYFVTLGFALVQQITDDRALVYEWNTLARTGQLVDTENNPPIILDPDGRFRIEETGVKLRYRQTIGWPWLFFEADAERAFRRYLDTNADFDGFWRSLVKIEVQFREFGNTK